MIFGSHPRVGTGPKGWLVRGVLPRYRAVLTYVCVVKGWRPSTAAR